MSYISFKTLNKEYTIIKFNAPTNDTNKKYIKSVENFFRELEETMDKIPKHHITPLIRDFNAQIGKQQRFEDIVGEYQPHKRTNSNRSTAFYQSVYSEIETETKRVTD